MAAPGAVRFIYIFRKKIIIKRRMEHERTEETW